MKSLQLLCLAGVLASALNAGVIYDNIGAPSIAGDCINYFDPVTGACSEVLDPSAYNLYDSFTSGAAGQITGLQLLLNNADNNSGAVQVGLYADNSTTRSEV